MQRGFRWIAPLVCCLACTMACGDDDAPAADGGTDASADGGRSGRGGRGGNDGSGRGGRGGAGGSDAGAGDGDLQAITIRFKAKLGDEDLKCGQEYDGLGKTQVRGTPQDFRFFVEEVHLITASGERERVQLDDRSPFQTKDVALIDFTDRQGMCTVGGATVNTTITGKVPRGDYEGIEFVNGVPEALNHENIAVAKPPLQDASTYWGWASGYRFIMTSLVVLDTHMSEPDDADAGAHDGAPGANFVHIGSVGCSGNQTNGFTCSRSNRNRIRLDSFKPADNTIVADLRQVFSDIDLTQGVECHGPGPNCGPAYAAFGIDLDGGITLDSQQVYRVE